VSFHQDISISHVGRHPEDGINILTEEELSEIVASDMVEILSSRSLCIVSAVCFISCTLLRTETPVLIYSKDPAVLDLI
jgi:hypothetical protein